MSTFLGAVILSGALLAGCGAACDHDNVCAVTGNGDHIEVCDGQSFRGCNDGDRGAAIPCVKRPEQAVCTPNGWAFQPTGPAIDGGAGDAGK